MIPVMISSLLSGKLEERRSEGSVIVTVDSAGLVSLPGSEVAVGLFKSGSSDIVLGVKSNPEPVLEADSTVAITTSTVKVVEKRIQIGVL